MDKAQGMRATPAPSKPRRTRLRRVVDLLGFDAVEVAPAVVLAGLTVLAIVLALYGASPSLVAVPVGLLVVFAVVVGAVTGRGRR